MIFCIDSPVAVAVFTPSNTAACRTAEKLLLISGRLSRAVRAASAELLVSGMDPTFFSTRGTRKCRCLRRCETARIATSSAFHARLPCYLFRRRPAETLRPPQLRRTPERRRAVPVLPGLCSCVFCYLLSSQRESWACAETSVIPRSTYVCGTSFLRQVFAALRFCGKNFSDCLCRSKRHVGLHRSC